MAFERWVIANGKTDRETIDRHNAAIRAYNHGDDHAQKMRKASAIADSSIADAVTLNAVEDLDELHRRLVRV
jgi:ABC-type sulfate transport system substrate-binding protein